MGNKYADAAVLVRAGRGPYVYRQDDEVEMRKRGFTCCHCTDDAHPDDWVCTNEAGQPEVEVLFSDQYGVWIASAMTVGDWEEPVSDDLFAMAPTPAGALSLLYEKLENEYEAQTQKAAKLLKLRASDPEEFECYREIVSWKTDLTDSFRSDLHYVLDSGNERREVRKNESVKSVEEMMRERLQESLINQTVSELVARGYGQDVLKRIAEKLQQVKQP